MNDYLKIDLESTVKDFEYSLLEVKRIKFNDDQKFVNACQDLLELYREKLYVSVRTFSTLLSKQSLAEHFLKEYLPSLKYHSECQRLLEKYIQVVFQY